MAWVGDLLGFGLFGCAPQAPFSLVSGLQVCNAGRNLFFVFIGFRRQRFGLLCACGFVSVGLETCWGSGFSDALFKHLFLGLAACRFAMLDAIFFFCSVGSVSDVSAFLCHAVSHGLGWKPAGRRRRFGLFSWVSGLQVCNAGGYVFLFCGFRRQRLGFFRAFGFVAFWAVLSSDLGGVWFFFFSVGSVGDVSAFFCMRFRMAWVGDLLGFGLFFCLMGSVGDVSAFFMHAVSHGLGWRPAGVRAFRMRSPSTFSLG